MRIAVWNTAVDSNDPAAVVGKLAYIYEVPTIAEAKRAADGRPWVQIGRIVNERLIGGRLVAAYNQSAPLAEISQPPQPPVTLTLTTTEAQALLDALRAAQEYQENNTWWQNVPKSFADDAKRRDALYVSIIAKLTA